MKENNQHNKLSEKCHGKVLSTKEMMMMGFSIVKKDLIF